MLKFKIIMIDNYRKTSILEENQQNAKGDKESESELELEYLRAILLSKVGHLESENKKVSK